MTKSKKGLVPAEVLHYISTKFIELDLAIQPHPSLKTVPPRVQNTTLFTIALKLKGVTWTQLKRRVYMYARAYNCFWPGDILWPEWCDYVPAWGNKLLFWKQVKELLDKHILPICEGVIPLGDLENMVFLPENIPIKEESA